MILMKASISFLKDKGMGVGIGYGFSSLRAPNHQQVKVSWHSFWTGDRCKHSFKRRRIWGFGPASHRGRRLFLRAKGQDSEHKC